MRDWTIMPASGDVNYCSFDEASKYLDVQINTIHKYDPAIEDHRVSRSYDDPIRLGSKWIDMLLEKFPQLRHKDLIDQFVLRWKESGGLAWKLEQPDQAEHNVHHPYTLLKQEKILDDLMSGKSKEWHSKEERDSYRPAKTFEQAFARAMGCSDFPAEGNVFGVGLEIKEDKSSSMSEEGINNIVDFELWKDETIGSQEDRYYKAEDQKLRTQQHLNSIKKRLGYK